MNELVTKDVLELKVANFGPIVEAAVNLRPLTVFVGPSNTGKSYLATLIYALHWFSRSYRRGDWIFRGLEENKLSDATVDALVETVQALLDLRKSPDRPSVRLPSPVMKLIRSGFDNNPDTPSHEICRCFGIDNISALTRRGQGKIAQIELRRRMSSDSTPFEHRLMLAGQAIESSTTIPEEIPAHIDIEDEDEIEEWEAKFRTEPRNSSWLMEFLGVHVPPRLTDPLYLPAYYLPADRTGVMHTHSVVVSALIGNASTAGLRPATRAPLLSGVLADFLENLLEIDRVRRPRRRREHDLGAKIEETILGGSVRLDRSAAVNYPRFTYRPDGWKHDLPLMNASSMVSELAPVVLYLRHMVELGNVLIIEEPESHLHPAMQVEFTRQLAALVGAGVRVIVTTHSEWLLEELANIVQRSQLPEASRRDGDVALRPDQVGAWLFQPKSRPKGSVVTEICLDDSGLYPSGFDDVAAALHNDWADISSRIEAGP